MLIEITINQILRAKLHVLVGYSFEEFKKFTHKQGITYTDEDTQADQWAMFFTGTYLCKHNKNKRKYFLWLENFDLTPKRLAVLSHELNHFAFSLLTHYGININEDNDEFFCYTQDYFLEKVLAKLMPEEITLGQACSADNMEECESCQ